MENKLRKLFSFIGGDKKNSQVRNISKSYANIININFYKL